MAEGTAEVASEGEEGTGHLLGKIQQGELLQAFNEHSGLLLWKIQKISIALYRIL
jgi:hypothetical protein